VPGVLLVGICLFGMLFVEGGRSTAQARSVTGEVDRAPTVKDARSAFDARQYDTVIEHARDVLRTDIASAADSTSAARIFTLASEAAHHLQRSPLAIHFAQTAVYYSRHRSIDERLDAEVHLVRTRMWHDTYEAAWPSLLDVVLTAEIDVAVSDTVRFDAFTTLAEWHARAALENASALIREGQTYRRKALALVSEQPPTSATCRQRVRLHLSEAAFAYLENDGAGSRTAVAEARALAETCDDPRPVAHVQRTVADLDLHRGNLPRALDGYRALEQASVGAAAPYRPIALQQIVQTASKLGRFEEARSTLDVLAALDRPRQHRAAVQAFTRAFGGPPDSRTVWGKVAVLAVILVAAVHFGIRALRRLPPNGTLRVGRRERPESSGDGGLPARATREEAITWDSVDPKDLLQQIREMDLPTLRSASGGGWDPYAESGHAGIGGKLPRIEGLDDRPVYISLPSTPRLMDPPDLSASPDRSRPAAIECFAPDGSYSHSALIPGVVARSLADHRLMGLAMDEVVIVLYQLPRQNREVIRHDESGVVVEDEDEFFGIPVAVIETEAPTEDDA